VTAKQWKMEAQEENVTRNKKNGKIVNKRAERRIFQAETVVRRNSVHAQEW